MAIRNSCPSCNWTGKWGAVAVIGLGSLVGLAIGAPDPPKPAARPVDNPRVTRAAFDKIKWLMPNKDVESILGKGESVEDTVVVRAMGRRTSTNAQLFDWAQGGLWVRWKGKDHTLFAQFGGPSVVQNKDGSYSIGPNTQCCLVLFITKNPALGAGGVEIDWKSGTQAGHAVPPVDNQRVTRAAFDKIKWLMPRKDIERFLGKGDAVDDSVVLAATGLFSGRTKLYERVKGGMWMQWKWKNQTIFCEFGGPTFVQDKDGVYSIGPDTHCILVFFMTESPAIGQWVVDIDYKLGPASGHIHQTQGR